MARCKYFENNSIVLFAEYYKIIFIFLFSYAHIISNQKKFLLRRLKEVFLKGSVLEGNSNSEFDRNINFGYVSMRRKSLLGVTSMSPEKWEIRKVYRKEKELHLAGIKRVLHIFLCFGGKGLATN